MIRFFALTLFLLCFQVPFANADDDQKMMHDEITKALASWVRAYEAQDLNAITALYTPDALLAVNNKDLIKGHEAVKAHFGQSFTQTRSSKVSTRTLSLSVKGDHAILIALYHIELHLRANNTPPVNAYGRVMLIYQQDSKGEWLIRADMDNETPDAAAVFLE